MDKKHTNIEYEQELKQLQEYLLSMAGHVEQMINLSIQSVVNQDMRLAEDTILEDRKVNALEVKTDELCLLILAKRHPLASDLRFITLAFKMVTDLERIGDLAVNICERSIKLNEQPQIKPYEDIPYMAKIVQTMIKDAIDAFVNRDADKAQDVMNRDDLVDDLYYKITEDLLQIMLKDSGAVERGIHIQSVAKFLERMADHSVNLAEQVIFMVKGKDVRHFGKLE